MTQSSQATHGSSSPATIAATAPKAVGDTADRSGTSGPRPVGMEANAVHHGAADMDEELPGSGSVTPTYDDFDDDAGIDFDDDVEVDEVDDDLDDLGFEDPLSPALLRVTPDIVSKDAAFLRSPLPPIPRATRVPVAPLLRASVGGGGRGAATEPRRGLQPGQASHSLPDVALDGADAWDVAAHMDRYARDSRPMRHARLLHVARVAHAASLARLLAATASLAWTSLNEQDTPTITASLDVPFATAIAALIVHVNPLLRKCSQYPAL